MADGTTGVDNSNGSDSRTGEGSSSLWSSILASTERRRASASSSGDSKRLIVLGHHGSGKTTLLSQLGSSSSSGAARKDKGKAPAYSNGLNAGDAVYGTDRDATSSLPDLGLNFQYLDVSEEGEEDAPTRLSIFQLPSASNPPYSTLLPLAFQQNTLSDSLVLIVLDWERPWTFLDDLRGWLGALTRLVQNIESRKAGQAKGEQGGQSGEYIVQEALESLESTVRNYSEPIQKDASGLPTSSTLASAAQEDRLPLPPGSLTTNLGLNIVVVCTKSDSIQSLERNGHLSEEQIDHIQQTLRTICLQYGAALFFTSQFQTSVFSKLRSYILHRLFTRPTHSVPAQPTSPTSGASAPSSAAPSAASTSRTYPFGQRANVIDREQILVPTGWDSWGKIRVLRDGFDCAGLEKGWQLDMGEDVDESEGEVLSALGRYRETIVDIDAQSGPAQSSSTKVGVQEEQDFLRLHYDILAREAAKDPRRAGAARPASAAMHSRSGSALNGQPDDVTQAAARFFSSATGTGVVGPMASSSLSLPQVEQVLQNTRDPSSITPSIGGEASRMDPQARSTNPAPTLRRESSRQGSGATGSVLSPPLTSPHMPTSPSAGQGAGQNELLANFFQSLLNSKTDRKSPSIGGPGGSERNSPALPSSTTLRGSSGRKSEPRDGQRPPP